jgi:microcystin-dependent protein
MSEPFLGEIKIISWNYPPKGWAFCNGQMLPINQNQALFSLFGTMYGGNGQTTFGLPDFRGRVPIHVGGGFTQGQNGGQEFHTVTAGETPAHNHQVNATSAPGTVNTPAGNFLANSNVSPYRTAPDTTFNPLIVSNTGGSQPHENRQPFLVLNFIVALQGIFPSRN